jgi:hypothetical protein
MGPKKYRSLIPQVSVFSDNCIKNVEQLVELSKAALRQGRHDTSCGPDHEFGLKIVSVQKRW